MPETEFALRPVRCAKALSAEVAAGFGAENAPITKTWSGFAIQRNRKTL